MSQHSNVSVLRQTVEPHGHFPAQTRVHRVCGLLALVWLLSATDLFFTLWAHEWTPFVEGNPLAAHLLGHSTAMVVALKLATVATGTTIFWKLRHSATTEKGLWILLAMLVCLTLMWSTYTAESLRQHDWVEIVLHQHSPTKPLPLPTPAPAPSLVLLAE